MHVQHPTAPSGMQQQQQMMMICITADERGRPALRDTGCGHVGEESVLAPSRPRPGRGTLLQSLVRPFWGGSQGGG